VDATQEFPTGPAIVEQNHGLSSRRNGLEEGRAMSYTRSMTLVESITRELYQMPSAKLVEVARFVSELVPEVAARQRRALADSYGCMDGEDGEAFERAVLAPEVTDSGK